MVMYTVLSLRTFPSPRNFSSYS